MPSSLTYGSNTGSVDAATGIITGQAIDSSSRNHGILWVPIDSTNNALNVGAGQSATIKGNFTQNGGKAVINGTLDASNSTFELAGGTLGGSGTLTGTVKNDGGTMSPGNSPGTFHITGDFNQTSGGAFLGQLGGDFSSSIDHLVASGTATRAGTLDVENYQGFTPSLGETFDMMYAQGGVNGTFDQVTGLDLAYMYTFCVLPDGQTGRLTVSGINPSFVSAPEPISLLLYAFGTLAPFGYAVCCKRRAAR